MTNNDIYAILTSKPHNSHYLNRYFKFILWCQQNPTFEEYTENHHICPKADDLFSEYASFKDYSWNCVTLSNKQHFIAHVMLWKAYGGSQATAIDKMMGSFNSDTNPKLSNRHVPTALSIRYAVKAREESRKNHSAKISGKSVYIDSNNVRYFINRDDNRISELGLISINANREVTSARLDANQKLSDYWTNRMRYMDQNGSYHGSYLKDDPIIKELNLVPLRTQSQIDQNASRTALATEARIGTNIYNNGVEERFLDAPIDSTWVIGRLPYSEQGRKNQIEATRAACRGKKTYNNGLVNKFFSDTDIIPEEFVRGMKPRK
jgi:hypothetical protein